MEYIYRRNKDIQKLERLTKANIIENQAFFGVKGLGKTKLFNSYFTTEKLEELAREKRYLFVKAELNERKQGADLYAYLIGCVKKGVRMIPDPEKKAEVLQNMKEADEIWGEGNTDSKLSDYLSSFNTEEPGNYRLILLMDHFHNLGKDSEVKQEQYDLMRTLRDVLRYWIISDSDFTDVYATNQFNTSFFSQNFKPMTIGQIDREGFISILDHRLQEETDIELTEEEKETLYRVIGGIPCFIDRGKEYLCQLKRGGMDITEEALLQRLLQDKSCVSYMESWCRGLRCGQRQLLMRLAQAGRLSEEDIPGQRDDIEQLSDVSGLGLLHTTERLEVSSWTMNTRILQQFILQQDESFTTQARWIPGSERRTQEETTETGLVSAGEQGTEKLMSTLERVIQDKDSNVIVVMGDVVREKNTVNHNHISVNIENAVAGLEDLKRWADSRQVLLDEGKAGQILGQLPGQQAEWQEMSENEQEAVMDRYADEIFAADIFSRDSLSPEQMSNFFLDEEILEGLTPDCRKQFISGIQVYDIIQLCIDRFGLDMQSSESPRAILFGRAFERHMKDWAAPAMKAIPNIGKVQVKIGSEQGDFAACDVAKTTLGTYSFLLRRKAIQKELAQCCSRKKDLSYRNERWWNGFYVRVDQITELRNECCHSGRDFTNEQLRAMKKCIFEDKSIGDVLDYGKLL